MKLELKYLATYIPYNLKILHSANKVDTMASITNLAIHTTIGHTLNHFAFLEFKLILKPISFLKKDKEVLDNLAKKLSEAKTSIYGFESSKKWILEVIKDEDATALPFFLTELLISQHYDVFGLIEEGLAVDMNCL